MLVLASRHLNFEPHKVITSPFFSMSMEAENMSLKKGNNEIDTLKETTLWLLMAF